MSAMLFGELEQSDECVTSARGRLLHGVCCRRREGRGLLHVHIKVLFVDGLKEVRS